MRVSNVSFPLAEELQIKPKSLSIPHKASRAIKPYIKNLCTFPECEFNSAYSRILWYSFRNGLRNRPARETKWRNRKSKQF